MQTLSGGGQQTGVATPPDLGGNRAGQLDILRQLLGIGGGQQNPGAGGMLSNPNVTNQGGASGANARQGVSNFFGPLSPFQQQGNTGISQFLNQPSPQERTYNTAFPALQEMLSPGTGNPAFERDLAMANQQGNRFGSGNEVLRAGALANQWQMRNQAASTLGVLGSQAQQGQAQQVSWQDLPIGRMLSILGGALGLNQQATMGLPITQTPGVGQQLSQLGLGAYGLSRQGGGGTSKFGGTGQTPAGQTSDPFAIAGASPNIGAVMPGIISGGA